MHRRLHLIVLVGAALSLHAACSSSGSTVLSTPDPNEAEDVDAGAVEPAPDAGHSSVRDGGRDARPPHDAAAIDAADAETPTIDPACDYLRGTVPLGTPVPRASAIAVPFGYAMLVNGVRPSGNKVGNDHDQWFSFTVDAARDISLSISGSRTSAAFYFESDTTASFSIGGFVPSAVKSFKAGTYYVKIDDGVVSPTQGGAWDVTMRWVVPPPECADAGL